MFIFVHFLEASESTQHPFLPRYRGVSNRADPASDCGSALEKDAMAYIDKGWNDNISGRLFLRHHRSNQC